MHAYDYCCIGNMCVIFVILLLLYRMSHFYFKLKTQRAWVNGLERVERWERADLLTEDLEPRQQGKGLR